ncbi:MAG: hypothetical protein FJZ15_02330 [Candidatus Omnitrophica bacterium]|nr:hypothetical protein [Candidatus Omnitrophota bacterium]
MKTKILLSLFAIFIIILIVINVAIMKKNIQLADPEILPQKITERAGSSVSRDTAPLRPALVNRPQATEKIPRVKREWRPETIPASEMGGVIKPEPESTPSDSNNKPATAAPKTNKILTPEKVNEMNSQGVMIY